MKPTEPVAAPSQTTRVARRLARLRYVLDRRGRADRRGCIILDERPDRRHSAAAHARSVGRARVLRPDLPAVRIHRRRVVAVLDFAPLEQGASRRQLQASAWRAAILFLLGIIYNGGMGDGWSDIRVFKRAGADRLSVSAGLIYLYFRPRGQIAWFAAALIGY